MKSLTNWENVPENIDDLFGFVYLIINTETKQKYIGKKIFWSTLRKKVKGKKRIQVIKKESDWRYYKSSSTDVKEDIKKYGEDKFQFIILHCFETKRELTFTETALQFKKDVLTSKLKNGLYEYYNKNILNKFFKIY